MDIRIIINSIIIIFILHIIILNINYSVVIGKNKSNVESFIDVKENSISFLTDSNNNNKDDEFKKKLMKYIKEDEINKEVNFENNNLHLVEASNSYLSENNVPNFESNVADVKKFFNINYDNLTENELKSTSIESIKKINDVVTIDTHSKQPCNVVSYGRESTVNPDNWKYKNELPMNGGNMNGVFGFDSLESQFAIYNPNKLNLQTVKEDKFDNIPHDDLRKPIIYEN